MSHYVLFTGLKINPGYCHSHAVLQLQQFSLHICMTSSLLNTLTHHSLLVFCQPVSTINFILVTTRRSLLSTCIWNHLILSLSTCDSPHLKLQQIIFVCPFTILTIHPLSLLAYNPPVSQILLLLLSMKYITLVRVFSYSDDRCFRLR